MVARGKLMNIVIRLRSWLNTFVNAPLLLVRSGNGNWIFNAPMGCHRLSVLLDYSETLQKKEGPSPLTAASVSDEDTP